MNNNKPGSGSCKHTDYCCGSNLNVVEIAQGQQKFDTGIVVDHVSEVFDIPGENIKSAPKDSTGFL